MIATEMKIRILRQYLGRLASPVGEGQAASFLKQVPKKASVYVGGPSQFLKAFATWYLLQWGRQNYKMRYSYDLIEIFLGHREDEENGEREFCDVAIPLVIIYHHAKTTDNKQLSNLVRQVVYQRTMERKQTIVLAEEALPTVLSIFQAEKLAVVLFGGRTVREEMI